jgi:hypothetical protein
VPGLRGKTYGLVRQHPPTWTSAVRATSVSPVKTTGRDLFKDTPKIEDEDDGEHRIRIRSLLPREPAPYAGTFGNVR